MRYLMGIGALSAPLELNFAYGLHAHNTKHIDHTKNHEVDFKLTHSRNGFILINTVIGALSSAVAQKTWAAG